MNYGFFPDEPEPTPETKGWRPEEDKRHRVLVLGPPRTEKVLGPDGKGFLVAEILAEVDGELVIWRFGMLVFKQLKAIENDRGLDNVWVEVRRVPKDKFRRVEVVAAEQRVV